MGKELFEFNTAVDQVPQVTGKSNYPRASGPDRRWFPLKWKLPVVVILGVLGILQLPLIQSFGDNGRWIGQLWFVGAALCLFMAFFVGRSKVH